MARKILIFIFTIILIFVFVGCGFAAKRRINSIDDPYEKTMEYIKYKGEYGGEGSNAAYRYNFYSYDGDICQFRYYPSENLIKISLMVGIEYAAIFQTIDITRGNTFEGHYLCNSNKYNFTVNTDFIGDKKSINNIKIRAVDTTPIVSREHVDVINVYLKAMLEIAEDELIAEIGVSLRDLGFVD